MSISKIGGKAVIANGSFVLPDGANDFSLKAGALDLTVRYSPTARQPSVIGGQTLVIELPQVQPGAQSYAEENVSNGPSTYTVAIETRAAGNSSRSFRVVAYSIVQ